MKERLEKILSLLTRSQYAAAEHELEQLIADCEKSQHVANERDALPTPEMIERGCQFALSAQVSGYGGWPRYVEALYMEMIGQSTDPNPDDWAVEW